MCLSNRNTNTAQTLDYSPRPCGSPLRGLRAKSLLAILSTEKEKITAEPMGATTIFCFSCETNILHIISRFYVGIWDKWNIFSLSLVI